MKNAKFNTGDFVKIVEYGSLMMVSRDTYRKEHAFMIAKEQEYLHMLLYGEVKIFQPIVDNVSKPKNIIEEKNGFFIYDTDPELVDKTGIIKSISRTQGITSYSLEGIKGKSAWYHEKQLELISKNLNYK